jgi:hypothetical protein
MGNIGSDTGSIGQFTQYLCDFLMGQIAFPFDKLRRRSKRIAPDILEDGGDHLPGIFASGAHSNRQLTRNWPKVSEKKRHFGTPFVIGSKLGHYPSLVLAGHRAWTSDHERQRHEQRLVNQEDRDIEGDRARQ